MTYLCDHPICIRERDCDGHCNAALPPRGLIGWVLEWGAVTFPEGHPSRITCMSIHKTREEAEAAQADCDFNSQILPAYTQPTTSAAADRAQELERICAEAYQAVGILADEAGRFNDASVTKVMDNLSRQELLHEDVLPFPCRQPFVVTGQVALRDALYFANQLDEAIREVSAGTRKAGNLPLEPMARLIQFVRDRDREAWEAKTQAGASEADHNAPTK